MQLPVQPGAIRTQMMHKTFRSRRLVAPATVTLRRIDSARNAAPGKPSVSGQAGNSTVARRWIHSEETDMMLSCVYAGQVKVID